MYYESVFFSVSLVFRGGDAGGCEDQIPVKRRRGRRSRSEIEEALRIREQQEAVAKQAQSGIGTNVKEVRSANVLH